MRSSPTSFPSQLSLCASVCLHSIPFFLLTPYPFPCLPSIQYWVVYVDEDYQWAITTAGPPEVPSHGLCTTSDTLGIQGAGVYLVHRDPFPSPEVVQQMRDKAEELGLDVSVLQKVTHTGCDYSHSATGNE